MERRRRSCKRWKGRKERKPRRRQKEKESGKYELDESRRKESGKEAQKGTES